MPKTLAILFCLIVFVSCSNTVEDNYIKLYKWKCDENIKFKIFAFGGSAFKLTNDTISLFDSAFAVIIQRNSDDIKIDYFKDEKIVSYHNVGKITSEDTTVTIEIKQMDLEEPPVPPIPSN